MKAARKAKNGRRPSKGSRPLRSQKAAARQIGEKGLHAFFFTSSLEELAREQGVGPLDPDVLPGGWPKDQDVNEFLEETYRERGL